MWRQALRAISVEWVVFDYLPVQAGPSANRGISCFYWGTKISLQAHTTKSKAIFAISSMSFLGQKSGTQSFVHNTKEGEGLDCSCNWWGLFSSWFSRQMEAHELAQTFSGWPDLRVRAANHLKARLASPLVRLQSFATAAVVYLSTDPN